MTSEPDWLASRSALSVLIGWTLSARDRPDPSTLRASTTPRIGLSLGTLQEERWQRDRTGSWPVPSELGAEVLVQSGNSETARQVQDIESLLSRGVDVLVVVAHDPTAMARAVAVAPSGRRPRDLLRPADHRLRGRPLSQLR